MKPLVLLSQPTMHAEIIRGKVKPKKKEPKVFKKPRDEGLMRECKRYTKG